jgi:acyl-CoA synthetase (NDP forming)
LIGDAKPERYKKVFELILADGNVDGVLMINMLQSTLFELKDSRVIPRIASSFPHKPFVDVSAGGEDFAKVFEVLSWSSVPLFDLLEKAATAARVLRAYAMIRERKD